MHFVRRAHDVIGLTLPDEIARKFMQTILQNAVGEEISPVVAVDRVHKLGTFFRSRAEEFPWREANSSALP